MAPIMRATLSGAMLAMVLGIAPHKDTKVIKEADQKNATRFAVGSPEKITSKISATRASAVSHSGKAELGLKVPAVPINFMQVRPAGLATVEVDAKSTEDFASVSHEGAASMMISADLKSGALKLHPSTGQKAEVPRNHVPVAWVQYNNTVFKNGWGYLSVSASPTSKVSPEMKMYAAGFLEGFVTSKQIRDFQHNAGILMQGDEDRHHAMTNIQAVFEKNLRTICDKSQITSNSTLSAKTAPADPWWRHARFSLLQSWGMLDAYNHNVDLVFGKPMSMVDLMILNSDGETPELETAYDMEEYLLRQSEHEPSDADDQQSFLQRRSRHAVKPSTSIRERREQRLKNLDDREWRHIKDATGRCSALVRVTDGGKDLMVGHTTFSDYSEMNRIFKYYDFPIDAGSVRKMGFSSYPGVAGSTDDYYVMDNGLVVTETTISMLTDEPYDKLDDNGTVVPDFMRIMMANRLAKTGEEWAGLMKQSATGTYSSQWMVVDYNKFTPGKQLQDGILFVIEQIPGRSHVEDMTKRLKKDGFWASENRAFFKDVRDDIGATEAEDLHGSLFSAEKNPRATIFKATAPQVKSIGDMRSEMQRNRWPHEIDGGELNTPDHAISARGDLDKKSPNANGGVDSKVTNYCMVKKLQIDAISGPTHDGQTPFRWNDESGKELYPGAPHDGEPNVWNFDWVRMSPDGEHVTSVQC